VDKAWMRRVAAGVNMAETVRPLRWSTPPVEVGLRGDMALAAALVLWPTRWRARTAEAVFQARSGRLSCRREGDWIATGVPAQPPKAARPTAGLAKAFEAAPVWIGFNGTHRFVGVAGKKVLRRLDPDFRQEVIPSR